MLKGAGILLIIAAGAGLGFSQSFALTGRMKALRTLQRLVILLKGEIQYGNTSLHDAFSGAAEKMSGEYGEFLKETAKRMTTSQGQSFGQIFHTCAREKLGHLKLSGEEREAFYSLGYHLGYLDLRMQIRQLDLYEEELRYSIEELQAKLPEMKKICQSLGIMGGILLAVLVW
ncbi:MAG TPA: stage III sporulation protein AB [Candidatus Blautia faecavium]|uniref:Stage III sporulation protein AB n=1 Tax=Candidatus Blautia faecavium TaxID=2838487 RepID=A0A9D2LUY9_9FIRM|nr:stage III sporulation protein AB [Candidatus Blautia faecavium]